jgi:hypothetical protein
MREVDRMKLTPEILRADKEIRGMLWPFDFEVQDDRSCGPVWFDTRRWNRSRSWRSAVRAASTRRRDPSGMSCWRPAEGQAGIVGA